MTDAFRLAIMAAVGSLFPVLTIFGVGNFTAAQVAAITVFINNFILVIAFFFKSGQQAG